MKNTLFVPVLLGLSLSGIGLALAYLSLRKKDEDSYLSLRSSRQTIIEMKIPKECIGAVIGRQGCNIKDIQEKSGARINFKDEAEDNKFRVCVIRGTPESAQLAESLIHEFIMNQPLVVTQEIWVPQRTCGRIIGRGGETIRSITRASCARVTVDSATADPERHTQRRIVIKGTEEQIAIAVTLINEQVEEEAEFHRLQEMRALNRSPRKYSKEPQNYLMAPQEEDSHVVTHRTERLQPNNYDGFIDVFVSAMDTPGQFWVQLVNQRGVELDQLEEKMTEFYSNAENRSAHSVKEVCDGQIVAAPFPFCDDHKWYRAKVMSLKLNEYDSRETLIELYYVDYGDSCELKQKDVCELRTDFLTLYFQAIECFLANVKPKGDSWSEESIGVFEELSQVALWHKKQALVKYYRPDPNNRRKRSGSPIPGIELHDFDKNINIGQELVNRGLALWEEEKCVQETDLCASSAQISKTKERNTSVAQNLLKNTNCQSPTPSASQTTASLEPTKPDPTKGLLPGNSLAGKHSLDGDPVESQNADVKSKEVSAENITSALPSPFTTGNKEELASGAHSSNSTPDSSISLQNGNSASGLSSATFIQKESRKNSQSVPTFRPRTLKTKSSSQKVQEESNVLKQPAVIIPEPLSDEEDFYDEDELGFSMG